MLENIKYYIVRNLLYLLSLLPFRIIYIISYILYLLSYHIIRYRRTIVRSNLKLAFPQKQSNEIKKIEKKFYLYFCDMMFEIVKLFSISQKTMMKRMSFSGIDIINRELKNKNFVFVYLGHYCNWEWIASVPYWMNNDIYFGQIYHPLKNKTMDKIFVNLRNSHGGHCITMKHTAKKIFELKAQNQKSVIGFISDQSPKKDSIHYWSTFFNQKTAMFTGAEKIGKKFNASVVYTDIKRIKRGYYHCEFKEITNDINSYKDFEITDRYNNILENMITNNPQYWLWSHKRWKHKKE